MGPLPHHMRKLPSTSKGKGPGWQTFWVTTSGASWILVRCPRRMRSCGHDHIEGRWMWRILLNDESCSQWRGRSWKGDGKGRLLSPEVNPPLCLSFPKSSYFIQPLSLKSKSLLSDVQPLLPEVEPLFSSASWVWGLIGTGWSGVSHR